MSQSFGIKMLLIVATLATLFIPLEAESIRSLLDLPLVIQQGHWRVYATLTDQDNGDQYFMQEFISAQKSSIKGKIVTSSERESFDIYYAFPSIGDNINANGPDTKRRLVIHDSQCSPFEYKDSWDSNLPGVSKPLTNAILLMGPSILLRINHDNLIWQESAEKDVRGIMMKSANTTINHKLNITFYYKKSSESWTWLEMDIAMGVLKPSRIEFSGNDPGQVASSVKENLILDIYYEKQGWSDDFSNIVQPEPEIGCPYYFEENLPLPEFKADFMHMIMKQVKNGQVSSKSTSEIYASNKFQLMRLTTDLLGVKTKAIYDFSLGAIFKTEESGTCSITQIERTSLGLNSERKFSISTLLLVDIGYQYLGQINFGHRSGFPVKVWESVQYDAFVEDQKHDKVVITQYFAESAESDSFSGHILVSSTISAYKLDSSKKNYIYTQGINRDYMDVQTSGTDAETRDIFSLSQCIDKASKSKLNLKFKLECTDFGCMQIAETYVYKLKEEFRKLFLTTYFLSPLRLDDMQISFTTNEIFIAISVLEAPILTDILKPKTIYISDKTIQKSSRYTATSDLECLSRFTFTSDDVIIYCPERQICGSLANLEDVVEDVKTGLESNVYDIPLHNLRRLKEEVSLQDLHYSLLQTFLDKKIHLQDYDLSFKVVDIIEEASADTFGEFNQLFSIYAADKRIVPDDLTNMEVPNVNTFADCYRACVNSDDLNCHAFSYCKNGDGKIDCRLSNLTIHHLTMDNSSKNSCYTYKRNSILDYSVVEKRMFKSRESDVTSKSLAECAELCSESEACLSFEFCGEFKCTFGGTFIDSITTYSKDCQIYTPKLANAYEVTGHKLTTDVIHTELDLNLDQCASLCYNWADDDNACNSFNFCPKSQSSSSCSLSVHSVKSSTSTIDGGECYNYELRSSLQASSSGDKQRPASSQSSTNKVTRSAAFGIIMIFVAAGLLLGFFTPFTYKKINQMCNPKDTDQGFTWSRQNNDQMDDIRMDQV